MYSILIFFFKSDQKEILEVLFLLCNIILIFRSSSRITKASMSYTDKKFTNNNSLKLETKIANPYLSDPEV